MIDTNFVDDLAFLVNYPAQAESLLHSPEQAAWDISRWEVKNAGK